MELRESVGLAQDPAVWNLCDRDSNAGFLTQKPEPWLPMKSSGPV